MNKSIKVSFGGQNVKVADFLVNRLLPSEHCGGSGRLCFWIMYILQFKKSGQSTRRIERTPSSGNRHINLSS